MSIAQINNGIKEVEGRLGSVLKRVHRIGRTGYPRVWSSRDSRKGWPLSTRPTDLTTRYGKLMERISLLAWSSEGRGLVLRDYRLRYANLVREISRFVLEGDPRARGTSANYAVTLRSLALLVAGRLMERGGKIGVRGLVEILALPEAFHLSFSKNARYEFRFDYFTWNVENWKRDLRALTRSAGNQILEVGCLEGMSSAWLAENLLRGPNARLVCVDPLLKPYGPRFRRNVKATGKGRSIEILQGRSADVLPGLESNRFDFVYIDGSHSFRDCLEDARQAWRLLKTGGLVKFDDYEGWWPGDGDNAVKHAVSTFVAGIPGSFEILSAGNQITLRKLR